MTGEPQRLTLVLEGTEIDIVLDALELFGDWFVEDRGDEYDHEAQEADRLFWGYTACEIPALRQRIAREAGQEEGGEPDAAGT